MRASHRLQCNFVDISFFALLNRQLPAFEFQVNSWCEMFTLRYASIRAAIVENGSTRQHRRVCASAMAQTMKYTWITPEIIKKNAYIPLSEWHEMFMSPFYDATTVRCVLITLTLIRNGIRQCDAQHTPADCDEVLRRLFASLVARHYRENLTLEPKKGITEWICKCFCSRFHRMKCHELHTFATGCHWTYH